MVVFLMMLSFQSQCRSADAGVGMPTGPPGGCEVLATRYGRRVDQGRHRFERTQERLVVTTESGRK